jgi:hypothetical protein
MGDKGPHAFPYRYQVWAYDANDLAAVKSGTKQPWEVLPYAIWEPPINLNPTHLFGGATAYDASTGRLYVSQVQGESFGYARLPVIHVFQVNMNAQQAPSYKIKGKAMLFDGTVVLKNNGGDSLSLTSASRATTQDFSFPQRLTAGSTYNVTIDTQPTGYSCGILYGTGMINANADISNVLLTCHKVYGKPAPKIFNIN